MLDLLIIHPGGQQGIYGALGDHLTALEPPLWARLIAGYVRDHGFSVRIIDAEAEGIEPPEVATRAAAFSPSLICIAAYGHQPSASTQQMVAAGEIARQIKRLVDRPIVMVGGHPSALPERTLREEAVDYVVAGEGPAEVVAILEGQNPYEIAGVYCRLPRDTWSPQRRMPLIEDLGKLHGNVWDLLPMDRYRSHNWQAFMDLSSRQPYASIYTSLGCPWRCEFCCINAPFNSNRYRMRDPKEVGREIEKLARSYGVWTFKITDEMFVLNERHYTAICGEIARRFSPTECERLNIWAYARVDTVKPETLDMLRASGFRWLALGIESGSKHVRDGANKRMRTEDIVGTVKTIQAHGINVIGNFMFGLRDDDHATMQQTFDLAIECMPDFANFYCTMSYPGSALYNEAVSKGWKLPDSWRGYSQHSNECRPLDTEHIDGTDVLAFRDAAFNFFFTHPSYLAHVQGKFGKEALEHIQAMTRHKLKRKLLAA